MDNPDLRPVQIFFERWPQNETEFTRLVNALRTEFDIQIKLSKEGHTSSRLSPYKTIEFHGFY